MIVLAKMPAKAIIYLNRAMSVIPFVNPASAITPAAPIPRWTRLEGIRKGR
jgi:hypothetical protein